MLMFISNNAILTVSLGMTAQLAPRCSSVFCMLRSVVIHLCIASARESVGAPLSSFAPPFGSTSICFT